jgi:hypothetical protein
MPKQTPCQSLDNFHIEPVLDIHRNNLHQDVDVVSGQHTNRTRHISDKALLLTRVLRQQGFRLLIQFFSFYLILFVN